ncbi:MAG: c-type cytochrome [Hyphomicrobiaceae bacterium]
MRELYTTIAMCMCLAVPSASADDLKDYGEYLAGECTACHRLDGADSEIPPIIGWDAESFIAVIQSYKSGERENPAMVSVAQSLDDEQIKALAAYFGSLTPKE